MFNELIHRKDLTMAGSDVSRVDLQTVRLVTIVC